MTNAESYRQTTKEVERLTTILRAAQDQWRPDGTDPDGTECRKVDERIRGEIAALRKAHDAVIEANARPENRVFCGVFPTGFVYADRNREKHGDYARLAYLSFSTLALEVERDCPRDLAEYIRKAAEKIQARKGEEYQISTAGQTVTLGYAANARTY